MDVSLPTTETVTHISAVVATVANVAHMASRSKSVRARTILILKATAQICLDVALWLSDVPAIQTAPVAVAEQAQPAIAAGPAYGHAASFSPTEAKAAAIALASTGQFKSHTPTEGTK